MHDLEVVPICERSALATVTWRNLRRDGSVVRQWRQSCNGVRLAESWPILAATFPNCRAGSNSDLYSASGLGPLIPWQRTCGHSTAGPLGASSDV